MAPIVFCSKCVQGNIRVTERFPADAWYSTHLECDVGTFDLAWDASPFARIRYTHPDGTAFYYLAEYKEAESDNASHIHGPTFAVMDVIFMAIALRHGHKTVNPIMRAIIEGEFSTS